MLRQRLRADDGMSLVELLVVILIVGILVAAALPTLLGQRAKAQDTNAMTAASTAAKAATAVGADRDGFTNVTRADLVKTEKSLDAARNLAFEGTETTFTVSVQSAGGTTFSITRAADGELTRDCTPIGAGNCAGGADARGNRW